MLAWVFWHARFEHVREAEYVDALDSFHKRLRAAAPPGLVGLRTLRHHAVPWLKAATEVHEDWHFLADSAALDRLDEAAVAAAASEAHERIARLAAAACAGLYRLQFGQPGSRPRLRWLEKPRGMPPDAFVASLPEATAVWRRQMVLGPTPEYAVESQDA